MNQMILRRALLLAALTTTGCLFAENKAGWPTEQHVKDAIMKSDRAYNLSDTQKMLYHTKSVEFEFKSIKFGQTTVQKQVTYGAVAQTVYPVKVDYVRIFEYSNGKAQQRQEWGSTVNNNVYFFFKDGFGDWTFKTGN